ncbi:phosphotransferase family protein [Amycolatopsis acidicola]|uniref:Phosphotransferase family protein n=1 Tax=Amycolatopsis acidicola TaxID=2596893 RepID=A0A5N0VIZ9_9PSEU|nr:phosphotransferase family protein [Amycolatopsis acidicola]KAA9166185.1 phosphotransferase family protein [Amycolatopsis acidicola]
MRTTEQDLDELSRGLAAWLSGPLAANGPVSLTNVQVPEGGGLSSVTFLADAEWREGGRIRRRPIAARVAPENSSFPVFPEYDLRLQYDVMAAVARHGRVPVPPLIGIDATGRTLGSPFLVMDRMPGEKPGDNPPYVFGGWLYDASPDQRRAVQDATVDVLAGIHSLPEPATRLPALSTGGKDALRCHYDRTTAHYEWSRRSDGMRIPVLENAFAWLEERWPRDTGEPVLSWGDARPGNILYEDFAPRAVLDWEMAALGPREIDLGWYVFLHRFFQDIAESANVPGLPDFARRDDVVETYEDRTGYRVREFDWYLVYAAVRHGVVMSQIARRMIHFGELTPPEDPDGYILHHEALDRLVKGTYAWPTR